MNRHLRAALFIGATTAIALPCKDVLAADPTTTAVGRWRTVDEAGKAKAIVNISERDGALVGAISSLLQPITGNPTCVKCTDDRKGKPIVGLEIIRGTRRDGAGYKGGTILDPENGKSYRLEMRLADGGRKLEISGCIAFFCKTQVWTRE
jgi:uncharacterized protein (DUF2147 family)